LTVSPVAPDGNAVINKVKNSKPAFSPQALVSAFKIGFVIIILPIIVNYARKPRDNPRIKSKCLFSLKKFPEKGKSQPSHRGLLPLSVNIF